MPRLTVFFLVPVVAFILCLTVFPLAFSLYLSLSNYNLLTGASGAQFVGFRNFEEGFPDFFSSLIVIVEFVAMAVPVEIALGLGIALLMLELPRMRRIMTPIIMMPIAIPGIAAGLMWRYMYEPDIGIINGLLLTAGMIRSPLSWLGLVETALPSLVMVDIWNWTPFTSLIILAGLYGLPREPFEAAEVEGASAFAKFRYLTLPMLRPVILVAFIFRLFDALNFFQVPFITTGGGPGAITETVAIYLYILGFRELTIGHAAAISYIMLIVTVILSYPAVKWLQKPR
jgi:multiple sugar transport system permease protein